MGVALERIAKEEQTYGSKLRRIKVGQRFHVEPQDVHILLALGRIQPIEGEPGFVQQYRTREMKARRAA